MPAELIAALGAGVVLGGFAVGLLVHRMDAHRRQADRQRFESESRKLADERATLAATAERERIYNDLHDDLGARLLQLVYAAPNVELADQARAALQDLRDVVSRSRGCAGTLEDVLADIEREARQRLASAGIELDWHVEGTLPSLDLPNSRALHLYRIVREAISNALRHAQPSLLRIRLRLIDQLLALELSDDGARGAELAAPGQGMRSMQQRAEALHGAIRWTRGSAGGAKVILTVPLDGETERARDPG